MLAQPFREGRCTQLAYAGAEADRLRRCQRLLLTNIGWFKSSSGDTDSRPSLRGDGSV